ncbi:MAG TPA: asparagine--tRNA ligase, partial [Clostridiales bacterium]|nr:asparagine--tRNA ligase [Clostridiales bacterium]
MAAPGVSVKEIYADPKRYAEGEWRVSGWARSVRDSKTIGFIELNDGSAFRNLQVVLEEQTTEGFDQLFRIGTGAALAAEGKVVLTPGAKQPFELKATKISIVGACPPEYPLQKKRHSFEYLRTIAHLRPRTNTFSAVFRVRSLAAFEIHRFFQDQGFVYVNTPIITASDCEGAGEMFRVSTLSPDHPPVLPDGSVDYTRDFFGRQTNLTVSGQLEAETFAMAFSRVYTFGPTFRAENSNTQRHASEFWMIEPEIAFAGLPEDMDLAAGLIRHIIGNVLSKAPDEMEFFNAFIDPGLLQRLENVYKTPFSRITYTQAVQILEKDSGSTPFNYPVHWGSDLQTEHERHLTEKVFKGPVFVTDYPKEIKAFYMRRNDDNKTVAAMDLLVPGVG